MSSVRNEFNQNIEDNNLSISKFPYKRIFQILLTEIGFIIILGIILLLVKFIPKYHSKKIFISKEVSNYEFNQDPIIFIHTTDLHMSINRQHRTDGSSIFLRSLCEYNPDIFLLTGDYVDNVKKGEKLGQQNLEEWKIYNTTIRNYLSKKGFKVIDVSGNHDLWALDSYDSKDNNFLGNSFIYNKYNVKNESDFFLRIIKVNIK